ncbi:4'-phosphopantetheinyl transferase superfamily [Lipomyces kononenkoae]
MSLSKSVSFARAAISNAAIRNIHGLGVDLVYVPRITALLYRKPVYLAKFSQRILHEAEYVRATSMIDCRERHDLFIARCWAIKEALFKSLDNGRQSCFQMRDWNTIDPTSSRPTVSGGSINKDEAFFVTVTHDGDYLLAAVIRGQSEEMSQ